MTRASTDEAFESALKTFEQQVGEATQIWLAVSAINEVARRSRRTLKAINRTSLFWRTVQGALERYALIAIGRIFDESRGAHRSRRSPGVSIPHEPATSSESSSPAT